MNIAPSRFVTRKAITRLQGTSCGAESTAWQMGWMRYSRSNLKRVRDAVGTQQVVALTVERELIEDEDSLLGQTVVQIQDGEPQQSDLARKVDLAVLRTKKIKYVLLGRR